MQRPVNINYENDVDFLPESLFKPFLDDKNNAISFTISTIDCSNCCNQWMIRDNKTDQVKNAICNNNATLTLFSNQVKDKLSKCDLSSINCSSGSTSTKSLEDGNGLFGSYRYNMFLVCLIVFKFSY